MSCRQKCKKQCIYIYILYIYRTSHEFYTRSNVYPCLFGCRMSLGSNLSVDHEAQNSQISIQDYQRCHVVFNCALSQSTTARSHSITNPNDATVKGNPSKCQSICIHLHCLIPPSGYLNDPCQNSTSSMKV